MSAQTQSNGPKKLLVLGASGMLGNAVFRFFANEPGYLTRGVLRSAAASQFFSQDLHANLISGVDADDERALKKLLADERPDIVVNCIGLVKQLVEANDPLVIIPINAMLPHRLARLCAAGGARLVHLSTDCVFSGKKGLYTEGDFPDCDDLYGRSKLLGEVDYPNSVTLRTSMVGHELNSAHGLINWFLAQHGSVKGFTRAIFSGLPTVEVARVIRDHVVPNPELRGVYHLSAEPISKYDLLKLVADVYGKAIAIRPAEHPVLDRSLNSDRFNAATGYEPPSWRRLVEAMHDFG